MVSEQFTGVKVHQRQDYTWELLIDDRCGVQEKQQVIYSRSLVFVKHPELLCSVQFGFKGSGFAEIAAQDRTRSACVRLCG